MDDAMSHICSIVMMKDVGSLADTFFFMRIHILVVNIIIFLDKHCSLYLLMIWVLLTPVQGFNITSKYNIVSENISNIIFTMQSNVV